MQSEFASQQEPGKGNLLRFAVGPYQFCLSALEVVAIITPPRLTVLPMSAADVAGVFTYQSQIAVCIDLRRKFALRTDPDKDSGELLLGHVGDMLVAFWVDHVTDIVASDTMSWSPLPQLQADNNVFSGCYLSDQDIILITSIEQMYHGDRGIVSTCLQALVSEQVSEQMRKQTSNQANNPVEPLTHAVGEPLVGSAAGVTAEPVGEVMAAKPSPKIEPSPSELSATPVDDSLDDMTLESAQEPVPESAVEAAPAMQAESSVAVDPGEDTTEQYALAMAALDDGEAIDSQASVAVQMDVGGDDSQPDIESVVDESSDETVLDVSDRSAIMPDTLAPVLTGSDMAAMNNVPGNVNPDNADSTLGRMDELLEPEGTEVVVVELEGPDAANPETESDAAEIVIPETIKAESIVVRVTPPDDFIDETISGTVKLKGSGNVASPSISSVMVLGGTGSVLSGSKLPWFLVMLALLLVGYWLWPSVVDEQQGVEQRVLMTGEGSDQAKSEQVLLPLSSPGLPPELSTMEPSSVPEPVSAPAPESEKSQLREIFRIEDSDLQIRVEREDVVLLPRTRTETVTPKSPGVETVINQAPVATPAEPASQVVSELSSESSIVPEMTVARHFVVSGDTLWHIAKKYLGNPYRYPQLVELSQINNPDLIYPGDIVTIEFLNSADP